MTGPSFASAGVQGPGRTGAAGLGGMPPPGPGEAPLAGAAASMEALLASDLQGLRAALSAPPMEAAQAASALGTVAGLCLGAPVLSRCGDDPVGAQRIHALSDVIAGALQRDAQLARAAAAAMPGLAEAATALMDHVQGCAPGDAAAGVLDFLVRAARGDASTPVRWSQAVSRDESAALLNVALAYVLRDEADQARGGQASETAQRFLSLAGRWLEQLPPADAPADSASRGRLFSEALARTYQYAHASRAQRQEPAPPAGAGFRSWTPCATGTTQGASPEVLLMEVLLLMHQLGCETIGMRRESLQRGVDARRAIHEQQRELNREAAQCEAGKAQAASGAAGDGTRTGLEARLHQIDRELKELDSRERTQADVGQLTMMQVKQEEQLLNFVLQVWNAADDAKKQTLTALMGSISR
jgi:hypothetical protein